MNERDLRGLIGQVKAGAMSRRAFDAFVSTGPYRAEISENYLLPAMAKT